MESGGFFNAEMLSDGSYDMNYVAEQFAQYFALFVGNGIFVDDVNNLQASSAGGMNVKFNKGAAFWDGYWYINSESLTKVVDINLNASARIDSFVVRFDIAGRKNSIEYKKGDTSVQRADGVYELQLCTIRVDAGSTSITDSNITDTRTNENVCGFVKGLLEVVQTDDLFKQFSDMFNTWFNGVKGILDGDAAGNILGMIGLLDDLQTDDKTNIVAAVNEVKQETKDLEIDLKNSTSLVIRYPDYTIEKAISLACDNELATHVGGVMCHFVTSGGEYVLRMQRAATGAATGIVQNWSDGVAYSFRRTAGADAVLKKLGSVGGLTVATAIDGMSGTTGASSKTTTVNVNSLYSGYADLPSTWFNYIKNMYSRVTESNPWNGQYIIGVSSVTYVPSTGKLTITCYGQNIYQNSSTGSNRPCYFSIPIIVPSES